MCPAKVQSVDDFVPDEGLDKSFLEDSLPSKAKVPQPPPTVDSESDGEDRGNPMVAGDLDELDPEEKEPPLPQPNVLKPSKDITLSSDEGEGELAPAVLQDEDLESDSEQTVPVFQLVESQLVDTREPTPPVQIQVTAPPQEEQPVALSPSPAGPEQPGQPIQEKKVGTPRADDSDTDQEAPVAKQMLSFVMDDPDFEPESADIIPKVEKDLFPVSGELLSDLSDDEKASVKVPEPLKPTVMSFKHKDDSDLFGLGFQEEPPRAKESSEEQDEKDSKHSSKEKKKKKKKIKEDEDKSSKKKHRQKKKDETETGDEKEKKKKKSRPKKSTVDDLEDFLGGGEGSANRDGGDYEEL